MGFFKGTRALISNIAQIVLIVILMPFIAILLGAVFGTDAGGKGIADVLVSLAGKIPLCDVWLDIYYQHSGGLSAQDVMSSTVFVILKALPEALIAAVCVYICVQISKKLKSVGLPIFATFAGLLLATVITSLTGLSNSAPVEIIADYGVLIVLFIGLKIMTKSIFRGMKILSAKKILLFFIDGLCAVITTAYISGLFMAAAGAYSSVGQAVARISILSGIELVVAVVAGVIGDLAEKDPGVF